MLFLLLKNEELNLQQHVEIDDDLVGDPDEEINLNNPNLDKEDDEDEEVEFEEVVEQLTSSSALVDTIGQVRIPLRQKSADATKSHALDSIRFSMFNIKSKNIQLYLEYIILQI